MQIRGGFWWNSKKNARKSLCLGLLLTVSVVGSVFAANGQSVTANIEKNESSVESTLAIWNCQDYLELVGTNSSNSTNSLYVQCYEQRNSAIDRKEKEFLLAVNQSSSVRWKLSAYNSGKAYYVKLNPKGALKRGCEGSGTLFD